MPLTHIDFFINNICNLACSHCYVSPEMDSIKNISSKKIIEALDEAINLGVRTIGCTGKEPLLTFGRTEEVFEYLHKKKLEGDNILYGIVTNGTLLDIEKAKRLNDLELDYLDVSIDGDKEIHNSIRGNGTYEKTTKNLENLLALSFEHLNKENIFIDFTLNQLNEKSLTELPKELSKIGLKNIYISPYQPIRENDHQTLNPTDYVNTLEKVIMGSKEYQNMNLFFKNDFRSKENIKKLTSEGIIDMNNLYEDEIKTIYSRIKRNYNNFYFNLLNNNQNLMLRINSNGDITNCNQMFKNQEYSPVENIKQKGNLSKQILIFNNSN